MVGQKCIFLLAELQCIHRESDVSRDGMTSPVAPGRFWRTLEIPWWDFATVWPRMFHISQWFAVLFFHELCMKNEVWP